MLVNTTLGVCAVFVKKAKNETGSGQTKNTPAGVFDFLLYFFPPFLAFFAASITRFASSRFLVLWGCDIFLLVNPVRLFAIVLLSVLINNVPSVAENKKKRKSFSPYFSKPPRQQLARNANSAWHPGESRSNTRDISWWSDRLALLCANAR